LFGVDAFLPGSQIDLRQVKNFGQYIGLQFPFRIIKLNKSRRNIVVSRRVVLEEEREQMRATLLAELEKDQTREGIVKNITDFGAFIDLGGADGLLHITDMSWGRVNHPSDVITIGATVNVKVLNYDRERERISLGLKQLSAYPWENVEEKYPVSTKVVGRVVSITDYGAFVELEEGVEGLIHISEMSWTQHVRHPSKILTVQEEVETMVLRVNAVDEKISLGLKQCQPDPWESLDVRYPVGSCMVGAVRNITNFGVFVEIEPGIDGLVHISDLSWTKRVKHPSELVNKDDELEVVVLNIDKEQRRISLSHKHIEDNPWDKLELRYGPGKVSAGVIVRLTDKDVVVEMDGDIEGFVPISQLGIADIRNVEEHFAEGETLNLVVSEFDREQKRIILSAKEYLSRQDQGQIEAYEEAHALRPVTIGDLAGDTLSDLVEQKNGETEEAKETSDEVESDDAEEDDNTSDAAESDDAESNDTEDDDDTSDEAESDDAESADADKAEE
ncbi:MAG: 30S ribosomal protein S1, partial [Candidatus Latescibacteria bacterium]|nr:30S ribosomal protein S1 [Candidatus Latescibacterota bacterium]